MFLWWGRRDLNPHASRHMILSHARLPISPRPRATGRFAASIARTQGIGKGCLATLDVAVLYFACGDNAREGFVATPARSVETP